MFVNRHKCFPAFYVIGNFVPITQKRSAGMRTAAYNADVASDRRRRKNVPGHILCSEIYVQNKGKWAFLSTF